VPDLPELVTLLYRADWERLSLSARATQRRGKDVHRRLRALAQAERDQELGPVPAFLWPRDDGVQDGPEWPETQVHLKVLRRPDARRPGPAGPAEGGWHRRRRGGGRPHRRRRRAHRVAGQAPGQARRS